MSTHCNFAVIHPENYGHEPRYSVAIVRGVMASGNSDAVKIEYIARNISLKDADLVARAARHIDPLNFFEYAPAEADATGGVSQRSAA